MTAKLTDPQVAAYRRTAGHHQRVIKGRKPKRTLDAIAAIAALYAAGTGQAELCRRFRCTSMLLRRELIAHLGEQRFNQLRRRHVGRPARPLTADQTDAIDAAYRDGARIADLCKTYGISLRRMTTLLIDRLGLETYQAIAARRRSGNRHGRQSDGPKQLSQALLEDRIRRMTQPVATAVMCTGCGAGYTAAPAQCPKCLGSAFETVHQYRRIKEAVQ